MVPTCQLIDGGEAECLSIPEVQTRQSFQWLNKTSKPFVCTLHYCHGNKCVSHNNKCTRMPVPKIISNFPPSSRWACPLTPPLLYLSLCFTYVRYFTTFKLGKSVNLIPGRQNDKGIKKPQNWLVFDVDQSLPVNSICLRRIWITWGVFFCK